MRPTPYEPFALSESHLQGLGLSYVSVERQQPQHWRESHWRLGWRGKLELLLCELQRSEESWFGQAKALTCQRTVGRLTERVMLQIGEAHTGFDCALRRENIMSIR